MQGNQTEEPKAENRQVELVPKADLRRGASPWQSPTTTTVFSQQNWRGSTSALIRQNFPRRGKCFAEFPRRGDSGAGHRGSPCEPQGLQDSALRVLEILLPTARVDEYQTLVLVKPRPRHQRR